MRAAEHISVAAARIGMAITVYTAVIEKEGELYAALCPERTWRARGNGRRGDVQPARGSRVVPRECRCRRDQASAPDRYLCNEDRSEAWVGSFSSTGSL